MQNIMISANIVAPVFLIILLGLGLKSIGLINETFINIASRFVYRVALPILIFSKIASTDFYAFLDLKQIGFVYVGTLFFFGILWFFSRPWIQNPIDRAVFIQGSFRSNFAIVGFALIANTFGNQALSKASILMVFVLILYNTLSILALSIPSFAHTNKKLRKICISLITNPLIIAPIFALPFSAFSIPLPLFLTRTMDYMSSLALPLALLSIGGSLQINIEKKNVVLVLIASLTKIIILPLTLIWIAFKIGFTGENLGIMAILFASPTAVVSFTMAEAMNCNSRLAGNIITITTLGSLLTASCLIYSMKILNWM